MVQRTTEAVLPGFLNGTEAAEARSAQIANNATTSLLQNTSTQVLQANTQTGSLPMRPITFTPTKEEALAKLQDQCVTWGISCLTRKKYTEVLDVLVRATEDAFDIPYRRPLWFDEFCGKVAKSKPPRHVKGRINIQENSFLQRVAGLFPVYAVCGAKKKDKKTKVKLLPGDTTSDFLEKLKESNYKGEAYFLAAFIKYMSAHIVPEEWTGYTEQDILDMDIGSMNKTFLDKRAKDGYRGWSYEYIIALGPDKITPEHEELLSGQCYNYWLIWDLVIPEGHKHFLSKTKWEFQHITEDQKASRMERNNGKRFYEMKTY